LVPACVGKIVEAASTADASRPPCGGTMKPTLDIFIEQLIALIAFFAFPAFSFWSWKWLAKNEGRPEIYYIPKYKSFRLVIRNLPRRVTLFDIKARVILRKTVLRSRGISVDTYDDIVLISQADFFLFPGNDQVLISFRLERRKDRKLVIIVVDKFGREKSSHVVTDNQRLVCDYIANVQNLFNFDIKLKKRAEVTAKSLSKHLNLVKSDNREKYFEVDRVRNVS
jgi:hypothetical protein